MAATQNSALRSALQDSMARIASVFPHLTIEAVQQSDNVREQLDTLRDELRWILGMVSGLHRLVQYYEADGQQILDANVPYCVLGRLDGFLTTIRENLRDMTVVSLQSTLRSLEPHLSVVALICEDASTLSGIHHRLVSVAPAGEPSRPGLKSALLRGLEAGHKGGCARRSSLEEVLTTTEPSLDDGIITRWMQELNLSCHGRPPLELFPELCLVRARNRQRPLYRVAASEWHRHADARWPVIKCEAEKLFSDPGRNNFIQWVLEFARARYPDPFECAGRPERAARIIELTNALEQGHLTPLHVSSMLGMSELCKSLMSRGSAVDSTGGFGSPLYCALWGPQLLVQFKQQSSWSAKLAMIEPANNDTIRALVSSAVDFVFKPRPVPQSRDESTLASLGFVASVKTRNHEIFQTIMEKGGSLDQGFRTMLLCLFRDKVPSDLRGLIARLCAIVLGYNLVLDRDQFPWERQDDIGPAICKIMNQNHPSLPRNTIIAMPAMSDEDFDSSVRGCVLNGDDMYLQRLALDARFDANLSIAQGDMENGTILHVVVSGQRHRMLHILASYGADFYAVDAHGRTPLMVVEDVKMLRLLVKRYGVSTQSTDVDGRNIWHYAAATNDTKMMKWLCDNDPGRMSNINSITNQGHSPLLESLLYIDTLINERQHASPPRPHVAYMLLQQEHLDVTRGSADLPIGHIAVRWGELDLINLLVRKGVDFAVLDGQGRSPLHHLNSSAEVGLVQRLVQLCGRLPVLSRAGANPIQSLYANSFLKAPGGRLSNHPSCFKIITEPIVRALLTLDILDAHNDAGQGCWALFCNAARHCFDRCSYMKGGVPKIVKHSFFYGLVSLHQHDALEAHENETGRPAILSLASPHDNGTISWSLETNTLIAQTLRICLVSNMKRILHTQHAFGLMAEALWVGKHNVIELLATEMPLLEPSPNLGGLCVLEYAMKLENKRLLSFHHLFSHVAADQLNSMGPRLCALLFEPIMDMRRIEKLSILLDQGLCPNTSIIQVQVPEKDTTILSEAVAHDWPDIVAILLARGADPGLGRTHKAITTALVRNSVDTLSHLIRQLDPRFDWNFTVFFQGIPGFNAIDVAIQARAHEALAMLFFRTNIKTIVHSRSDVNRGTPAHLAAWRNDIASIRMLRQHGADLARTDDQGRTILHIAAEISSPELMEVAAEFCPLGATDSEGRTAGDISASNLMVSWRCLR
ncbi:hypothetical protein E4U54_002775 [Claviceps lovelessii]|nr:hypothetical protein E4U54_002775 [Claviceps lovelessii]